MLRRSFVTALAAASAGKLRADSAGPKHPRLFLDAQRLDRLRREIESTHAVLWQAVRHDADSFAARTPPVYQEPSDPNDEQLWQREIGNRLPFFALAYLLTSRQPYLDAATEWSLACCAYPHWGAGREDGVDLAAGHQLFGLALIYDWLHADLPAGARDAVRRTLSDRGRAMYQAAVSRAYWRSSYLQNHLWVNAAGLAAAALALDDQPETRDWLDLARDKFRRTEAALGPDGASHEGVGYWSYGVEYLLKFWCLSAELLGENLSSPWWKHTADYRLYLGLPRNSVMKTNSIVDIADCPRWDWYGPDYLLRRLATLNRDGHAQWLAADLERAGVTQYAARWLNLLWYDPSVDPQPPADLPTLRHFEDLGIVSARSAWSGDESLVVFKCGPPIGHEATNKFDYDPGSGHVHPDANHFVIFGSGDWLLRDEGYAWKESSHHNTLLVDGRGQLGEDVHWFRGLDAIRAHAHPRILKAASTADLDEILGDAAPIYRPETGVKRFLRRLYFLKPNIAIVVDDIEVDRPRQLELRFHPEYPCERQDGAWIARGKKAILRLELLTPSGVEVSAGETMGKDRDARPMPLHTVCMQVNRATWRNAVALSWAPSGSPPPKVTLDQAPDRWIFRSPGHTVTLAL